MSAWKQLGKRDRRNLRDLNAHGVTISFGRPDYNGFSSPEPKLPGKTVRAHWFEPFDPDSHLGYTMRSRSFLAKTYGRALQDSRVLIVETKPFKKGGPM